MTDVSPVDLGQWTWVEKITCGQSFNSVLHTSLPIVKTV